MVNGKYRRGCRRGLTLVELLVVIAVLGILMALLLPVLGNARRQSRKTVCLNNFRQIAGYVSMYQFDHGTRIPNPKGGGPIRPELWCRTEEERLREAEERDLNAFDANPKTFQCPEDRGLFFHPAGVNYVPTLHAAVGSSYFPNGFIPGATRRENLGPAIGKHLGWVPSPAKFILLTEPSAKPVGRKLPPVCGDSFVECKYYVRWHSGSKPFVREYTKPILDRGISVREAVGEEPFLSPVLFVDGHVEFRDFGASLLDDHYYSFEETRDWVWYKAGDTNGSGVICPAPSG